ncbi:MAG: hypothetical protein A3I07_03260 [Candidatus Doudnabacteria bacterium RIFCSPLOWO2_02_FULL_42_9]|uniref:SD-repeat containing protein B domain-containing protein n=1 Tax=Candidatus Doudnabacteria bacterium RIFCSPHIGHO2_01_FULL_41_86 TaxID=1817821 RepID=A0A1F5N7X6_9BACT|nr:MAG: hypothetical protein A2717_03995 [Candidatus Doudnabacteria bacterium RIFCSPHIGHO2_01_FULL_41_86]OGE74919.1 MAG: hypothetical protein A3K07_02370 [Candidatus Doudnabacteria bacterium RIFCSPHIGHO2_01_43_10]OGE85795.1 MAG: hypothetical protein A3E28_03335 [Candidatus Doudnabacteria bacterium RIFCSPHIGHO2_12_FULL_42_22]OGE87290.1 MAG: hypothetical protein A3C49_00960 [Candidatus Doudnabacteria bacterium RIFCSPHIGHO2_02_FULL_42_25]OGE92127.1 MAG: hypothetical protein A2895_00835 [Candidatus
MKSFFIKKTIAIILLVGVTSGFLVKPEPAKAFLGFGDITFSFGTEIANPYDIAKDIGKAAVLRIASNYANEFITRFVDKVLDKYKIRNYLYYARLLESNYLNQYIANKIGDPDLREAFNAASTLYSYDFTGQANSDTREQNLQAKKDALKKISDAQKKYHIKRGGIDPQLIYNPPQGMSDREYFVVAQAYFSNPEVFAEIELDSQIGAALSQSQAAASQEIDAGQGLKSSREIVTITATGSAGLDKALNIIKDPSGYIKSNLDNALQGLFNVNLDMSNPYTIIGNALGNFVFKRLQLDSDGTEVIDEYSEIGYNTSTGNINFSEIDLDLDGIPDGRDGNNDGLLNGISDVCYHGGNPIQPGGCNTSSTVGTSPYFTPLCQAIDKAAKDMQAFVDYAIAHRDQVTVDNFINEADTQAWARRVQQAYGSLDNLLGIVQDFNNPYFDNMEIALGRHDDYLAAINMSLVKDKDLELDGQYGPYDGIDDITRLTMDIVNYIKEIKSVIGKCDKPNAQAASNVPVPTGVPTVPPGGGGGGGSPQLQPGPWSLTGKVFSDNNLNGVFDAGDVATVGNKVYLETPAGISYTTAVSDAQGNYSFTNFAAGDYRVTLDISSWPPGTIETTDRSHPFTVGPDHVWNFGYRFPQSP